MALHPAAQRECTLRELEAHLSAIAPPTGRAALMARHPALQGG